MSLARSFNRLRVLLCGARGRKLAYVVERINLVLRGWAGSFKLSQSKQSIEGLDVWVRRKLRCVTWRQWRQSPTRARNLTRMGLDVVESQLSGSLVALGSVTHESGVAEETMGATGGSVDSGYDKPMWPQS